MPTLGTEVVVKAGVLGGLHDRGELSFILADFDRVIMENICSLLWGGVVHVLGGKVTVDAEEFSAGAFHL